MKTLHSQQASLQKASWGHEQISDASRSSRLNSLKTASCGMSRSLGDTDPAVPGDEHENEWIRRLHEKLLNLLDLSLIAGMPERAARAQIRDATTRLLNDESAPLTAAARQRVVRSIENEVLGLGPLEALLSDPTIADILINRHDSVYVERNGRLEKTRLRFRDDAHLLNIIDRIVSRVGRRIDESSPMVDARLKDGSRLNAIIPPLALDGPVVSIRRFSKEALSAEHLVNMGSMSQAIAKCLEVMVNARLNVLVSGGTGSGKTTLLNVLSNFIGPTERVVTIEDSAELQLQQPHVIRLETRPSNIEGNGEVSQRDLVKNSLRMRPDRIVIGEVRGGEVLDMLQAMNTGHDGSLTTLHANSPRDALGRMENMMSMSGLTLPLRAMRAQIVSAIDVVVQLERQADGRRRVVSVQEVQNMDGDVITMSEIFRFEATGVDSEGNVLGDFKPTGLVPRFNEALAQRGLALDVALFQQQASDAGRVA